MLPRATPKSSWSVPPQTCQSSRCERNVGSALGLEALLRRRLSWVWSITHFCNQAPCCDCCRFGDECAKSTSHRASTPTTCWSGSSGRSTLILCPFTSSSFNSNTRIVHASRKTPFHDCSQHTHFLCRDCGIGEEHFATQLLKRKKSSSSVQNLLPGSSPSHISEPQGQKSLGSLLPVLPERGGDDISQVEKITHFSSNG